ncbi:MAG: diguanylate cyclase [Lysobacteraceae bacterium]
MLSRLLSLALLLTCLAGTAEERVVALSEGDVLRRFTSEEGLPQNSVNAIVQDHRGYLWLATFGGLARFDGSAFRVFRSTSSGGPASDRILSLLLDPQERLWIGTEGAGVSLLDNDGFRHVPVCGASCEVRTLWLLDAGTVLANSTSGAFLIDLDSLQARRVDSLSSHVSHVVQDASGRTFVANDHELWALDRHGATPMPMPIPGDAEPLLTMFSHDGEIWLWRSSGLLIHAPDSGGWRAGPAMPADMLPVKLFVHGKDIVVSALDGRMHRIDSEGRVLPFADWDVGAVRSVFNDNEGNLWLGSSQRGLFRIQPSRVALLNDRDSGLHLPVLPIAGDGNGGQWLGMSCDGLRHRRADGRVRTVSLRTGQHTGCPWSIHVGDDGGLLVGTVEGWLKALTADGELVAEVQLGGLDPVRAIHPAMDGRHWAAVGRATYLVRQRGDGGFDVETMPALDGITINQITPARAGGWWMSGDHGVLRVQDRRIVERWGVEQGLSSRLARAVLEEPDGGTWIGTYGGGLNYVANRRVHHYHAGNGLFDDVVSCLLFDHRGRLWSSGNRGIAVLGIEQLARARQGIAPEAIGLAASDGLRPSETNGGAQPACHRDRRGRLWFPLISGATRIDPDRALRAIARPLHPLIESISVAGQAQPLAASLRLSPEARNIAIGFGAPSLGAPEKVRYRFRLGSQSEWSDAGSQRSVLYPVMPWGEHVFEVEARNADGVWSTQRAALRIDHPQPFYRSPLTWVLAALLLPGLLFALGRLAARHLARQRAEREARLVHQRTRELEALTRIDPKTGIANHRHLVDTMGRALDAGAGSAEAISLLLLDIDDFKAYNDHFGHLAGDECLRRIALAMQAEVRGDDLLARFGGEEFAVFMRHADTDAALELAERLRRAVAALDIEHAPVASWAMVTISIGVVSDHIARQPRLEDLLAAADKAMYRAKRSGRNRVAR